MQSQESVNCHKLRSECCDKALGGRIHWESEESEEEDAAVIDSELDKMPPIDP